MVFVFSFPFIKFGIIIGDLYMFYYITIHIFLAKLFIIISQNLSRKKYKDISKDEYL